MKFPLHFAFEKILQRVGMVGSGKSIFGIWIWGSKTKATAEAPRTPRKTPKRRISDENSARYLTTFFVFLGVYLGVLGASAVAFIL